MGLPRRSIHDEDVRRLAGTLYHHAPAAQKHLRAFGDSVNVVRWGDVPDHVQTVWLIQAMGILSQWDHSGMVLVSRSELTRLGLDVNVAWEAQR